MDGHKLYEYALKTVPLVVKESLDKAGLPIAEIKKVLIHQANEKMDEAIVKRLFKICDGGDYQPEVMPMIISWLGNSSVATVPTLLDLILKGKLDDHALASGRQHRPGLGGRGHEHQLGGVPPGLVRYPDRFAGR